jgi:rod shape-determining protein MreC
MPRVVGSRRAPVMLAALVLLHLLAISHQVDAGGGLSLLERGVLTLVSPLQRLAAGTVAGVAGLWHDYLDLRGVRGENRRLRAELRELRGQIQEKSALASQAERLRALLQLREVLPYPTVVAEVIAREGIPWFRTLMLNKGSADGIQLNAPVIGETGVLGRVIAVGPAAARVQLLHDRDCGVAVRVERTRATGVVSGQVGRGGTGTTDLLMKYVPADAEIEVGDVVVTSGLDRIYPPGLMVGRVRSVLPRPGLFREVVVAPSARFDEIEEALVLQALPGEPVTNEVVE